MPERFSSGLKSRLDMLLSLPMRLFLKYPGMLLLIIGYLSSTMVLSIGNGGTERAMQNSSRFCRWALKLLGVTVTVRGEPRNSVIVANHLSYIDILTILSIQPCRFVTFAEMGKMPGVGMITKVSQSLFINRSRPSLVRKDIEHFEKELRNKNQSFAFFPEGASFDGSRLQNFKSPLFESSIRSERDVQPLCLRYLTVDGELLSTKNRHKVFLYGDMRLVSQLFSILKIKSLQVEAVFSEPISSVGKSRKELAAISHSRISEDFLAVSP
jgi:1-acyl-sn-glycerol-3-phosphate acyltransferase